MLETFKSYLKYGTAFCGIEHNSLDGKDVIYAVLLKKSKKELTLTHSLEVAFHEDLVNELPKGQHISLVINNDKTVTKIIDGHYTDGLTALNKAFPNIDVAGFLYEVNLQKDTAMVSICRKDYVEQLIEVYNKESFSVIDIGLGVSKLQGIVKWFNTSSLTLSNQQVGIEDEAIVAIGQVESPKDSTYNINGIEIQNRSLLAFSAALSSLISTKSIETNFSNQINELNDIYKHKRFFKQFFKAGLSFIFGLLLVNFLVFNHYYGKTSSNNEMVSFNKEASNKVKLLSEEVTRNKKLYEDVLRNNVSKSSFYLNDIAHSLPKSMSLDEINYQPLLKRVKDNQGIEMETGTIVISGTTTDHLAFSGWIHELEKKSWTNNVEIMDFADVSNSRSKFQLKIMFSDEP